MVTRDQLAKAWAKQWRDPDYEHMREEAFKCGFNAGAREVITSIKSWRNRHSTDYHRDVADSLTDELQEAYNPQ